MHVSGFQSFVSSISVMEALLRLQYLLHFNSLYRNQTNDLHCKSMDWFLYERDSIMKELKYIPERSLQKEYF